MTRTLSSDLNFCYTLLFTGDTEMKRGCYIRALLCFENCREKAEELIVEDTIYRYCYFRALRKEAQCLRYLGLHKRCYRVLQGYSSFSQDKWHSQEKLFVLLQLFDLSEQFEPQKSEIYLELLCKESAQLKAEE